MFEPWVGEQYGKPGNVLGGGRLLVLGESHYTHDAAQVGTSEPDGTKDAVGDYALPHNQKTFRNITAVLAGKAPRELSLPEVEAIWNAIAFYNYVPTYVASPSLGGRPSPAQWRAGAAPFRRVLAEHTPDGVLVCGLTTWDWLVYDSPGGRDVDTRSFEVFPVNGVPCRRIRHPGRGFGWRQGRPVVEALLAPNAAGR